MLYIHPEECVDCGACEPVCPVEAIFYDDDVPAQWKDFTATNAAFFTEGDDPLGSPGGFSKIGPQVRDTSSSPTTSSPTASSPAHEPTWADRDHRRDRGAARVAPRPRPCAPRKMSSREESGTGACF